MLSCIKYCRVSDVCGSMNSSDENHPTLTSTCAIISMADINIIEEQYYIDSTRKKLGVVE